MSPTTSTLSAPMPFHAFELSVTLSPSEIDSTDPKNLNGVPVLLVQPQVLIDGKPLARLNNPLSASLVTDLADVVLAAEHVGQFKPLTCSCGDSACVGIHDSVEVRHHDDRIDWHFPASYVPRLAERGLARPDDLTATFSFDAKAVKASVNAALAQIGRWEAEHDLPVVIVAHDPVDAHSVPSLQVLTQRWRANFPTRVQRAAVPTPVAVPA